MITVYIKAYCRLIYHRNDRGLLRVKSARILKLLILVLQRNKLSNPVDKNQTMA